MWLTVVTEVTSFRLLFVDLDVKILTFSYSFIPSLLGSAPAGDGCCFYPVLLVPSRVDTGSAAPAPVCM